MNPECAESPLDERSDLAFFGESDVSGLPAGADLSGFELDLSGFVPWDRALDSDLARDPPDSARDSDFEP